MIVRAGSSAHWFLRSGYHLLLEFFPALDLTAFGKLANACVSMPDERSMRLKFGPPKKMKEKFTGTVSELISSLTDSGVHAQDLVCDFVRGTWTWHKYEAAWIMNSYCPLKSFRLFLDEERMLDVADSVKGVGTFLSCRARATDVGSAAGGRVRLRAKNLATLRESSFVVKTEASKLSSWICVANNASISSTTFTFSPVFEDEDDR